MQTGSAVLHITVNLSSVGAATLNLDVVCVPNLCICILMCISFVVHEVVVKRSYKNVSITTQHPINGRKFTFWNYYYCEL